MHKTFFGDGLLLGSSAAEELYREVRELPIVDYHCHLNEREIRDGHRFENLGELWLGGDHYKWRAMRMCGVDETYITGSADDHAKYLKYAEIFPLLCGNPLYYWTQLELKLLFGITEPFGPQSAERIWDQANEKLKGLDVRALLRQFRVEYVATTDDPASGLEAHGIYDGTAVCPTFRPDRMLTCSDEALRDLESAAGMPVRTLDDMKNALHRRLLFFRSKGCRIADHGMDFLPLPGCPEERAAQLFARRSSLTAAEHAELSGHLTCFLAGQYAQENMVMQMHFATYRNVNEGIFPQVGRDTGFDIMRGEVNTDALIPFFNVLQRKNALPKTVLYSLNPTCVPSLAALSGAFPNVRIGAAWWFNDTVGGIRRQLETAAEYAVLGTQLGMLTDSRSFASYARFDFFRRILADTVGGYVERGEYDMEQARELMYGICYGNIRRFLGLDEKGETRP